jgi:hypothetical protein
MDVLYPRLIEASGRCPPEDPGHESHAETPERLGEEFDPHAFDAEQLKADAAALAKRRSGLFRPPTDANRIAWHQIGGGVALRVRTQVLYESAP